MNKNRLILNLFICSAIANSCVDEEYNLDKINDDMVIKWSSIAAPLGNIPAIKISDLIDTENSEYITTTSSGDYVIHFEGSHSEAVFNTPTFKMTSSEADHEIESVIYSPAAVSGISPVVPVKFKSVIEISDNSVPEEIVSVESAKIRATLNPTFSFEGSGNISSIFLAKGTTLEFPSWVTIGQYNTNLLSKNGTTLTFKEDIAIGPDGVDLQCSATEIDFTKLPKGQGLLADGELYVNDSLVVRGGVYIREQDIINNKVLEDSFTAKFSFNISEIEVISAKAVIKPSFELQFPHVDTKDFASIFKTGSSLDIYDMNVNMTVGNNSPLGANISADIDSYKDNVKASSVHIGPLEAKAYAVSHFTLGKRSGSIIDNLTDLISVLPDEISISNVDIETSDKPVEYVADSTYKVFADYSIDAPLAFGKDLSIELEHDLNVGLTLEGTRIGSIDISFCAENTIPLNMAVSAVILDEEGNVIDGSSVTVNGSIGAGTQSSPNNDDLKISIVPGKDINTLDSIRLLLRAASDNSHEGEPLNMNQGLAIKNVSLRINDLTIEL